MCLQNCTAEVDGRSMECLTPNISYPDLDLAPGAHIMAAMHFLLDEVQELRNFGRSHPDIGQMKYVVDPVFSRFTGYNNVRRFYMDENYLDIQVSADDIEFLLKTPLNLK